MQCATIGRMLIPQYSIRSLFIITAACGVVCLILSLAVAGHAWAISVSVAIGSLLLVLLLYAVFFLAVWLVAAVTARFRRKKVAISPFAQDSPPPQIIAPEEPE